MAMKLYFIVILSILLFLYCVKPSVPFWKDYTNKGVLLNPPGGDDGSTEKDVVVLGGSNFSEYMSNNNYVMVMFYAPWCYWSKLLRPEYSKAATGLKGGEEAVVLAKVDSTVESELSRKYEIKGYPTVYYFVAGVLSYTFYGDRKKDTIVGWVKDHTRPCLNNLTTTKEAEKILASGKPVALGFLNALVGSERNNLAAASQMEFEVKFYQTTSSDVAKLFHIDPEVKRPALALVVVKKEAQKIYHFDGEFTASGIADFASANKFPHVINITMQSAAQIFNNPFKKKKLILFSSRKDSEKLVPVFEEAVQAFNGKVVAVYVDLDSEYVGKHYSEDFSFLSRYDDSPPSYSYAYGVRQDAPTVLAYEDRRRFILDGEITVDNIKSFGEKFVQDHHDLKPFTKSDQIPDKLLSFVEQVEDEF